MFVPTNITASCEFSGHWNTDQQGSFGNRGSAQTNVVISYDPSTGMVTVDGCTGTTQNTQGYSWVNNAHTNTTISTTGEIYYIGR